MTVCGLFALIGADPSDDKCPKGCGTGILDPGPEPTAQNDFWAASQGVMGIITSVVKLMPGIPPVEVAATGIGLIFDGVANMHNIAFRDPMMGKIPPDSSAWQTWKLESTLKTMQDFLICQFNSLLGQYFGNYFVSTPYFQTCTSILL